MKNHFKQVRKNSVGVSPAVWSAVEHSVLCTVWEPLALAVTTTVDFSVKAKVAGWVWVAVVTPRVKDATEGFIYEKTF